MTRAASLHKVKVLVFVWIWDHHEASTYTLVSHEIGLCLIIVILAHCTLVMHYLLARTNKDNQVFLASGEACGSVCGEFNRTVSIDRFSPVV